MKDIQKFCENLSFILKEANIKIKYVLYFVEKTAGNIKTFIYKDDTQVSVTNNLYRDIKDLSLDNNVFRRIHNNYIEYAIKLRSNSKISQKYVIIRLKSGKKQFASTASLEGKNGWCLKWNKNSFFDYIIYNFLKSYISSGLISYKDIILKSGNSYIIDKLSTKDSKNLNIHNDLNMLSSMKYEGKDNHSQIIICDDIEIVKSHMCIVFDKKIHFSEYKKIRKLLEIANKDIYMIATNCYIYGFVYKDMNFEERFSSNYVIKIYGSLNWEVFEINLSNKELKPLIQNKNGKYQLSKIVFDEIEFKRNFSEIFPNISPKNIIKITKKVLDEGKGTTLVITDKAKSEADRLSLACFGIKSVNPYNFVENIIRIDGAVLLDPKGFCHAIGVILDGRSSGMEDISTGARHNSALRYKNINRESLIIVVSEDGYVTFY